MVATVLLCGYQGGLGVARMFLVVSRLVTNPYPSLYDSSPLDISWVLCLVCKIQDNFTHFIMDHFHILVWSMEVNLYGGTWKP